MSVLAALPRKKKEKTLRRGQEMGKGLYDRVTRKEKDEWGVLIGG